MDLDGMTSPAGLLRSSLIKRGKIDVRGIFAGFVLLHVVVWTALPLVFTHALPVDVVEGIIWGQGWQLSYIHPPLQAWLLGSANWLLGYQRWAVYLLSQLLVAISFWAVWRLARLIVSPLGALISVLILDGVLFFNFTTPNLFPDLTQLPFWALATWSFYRALRFGRLLDWGLLGLWLAAAAYGKYVSAVLAAVMIGFMLLEPHARRCWRMPGPYLCAGLCLLLLATHLWWVLGHGFPTIQHFHHNAQPIGGAAERLAALAGFTGGELGMVALAGLLILALSSSWQGEKWVSLAGVPTTFDRRFVAALALGPFLLTFIAAAASGLWFRVHWGYAMWCFIGLFAVVFLVPAADEDGIRRFGRAWASTFVLVALLYAGVNTLAPYVRQEGFDVTNDMHLLHRFQKEAAFPSRELATEITQRWNEKVGDRLAYVVGSKWVAGHISFFSPDHPLALRDASPARSPWIDMDQFRQRGAVVVWDPQQDFECGGRYPGWLCGVKPKQRFPMMKRQPPIILPWKTGAALPPLQIMWGIVYPSDHQATARIDPAGSRTSGQRP